MTTAEESRCVVCGGETRPMRLGATPLLVCLGCGMGAVAFEGNGLDYWSAAGRHGERPDHYWTKARAKLFRGALDLLRDESPGRRLLDLGGGIGYFAHCALQAGWDAYTSDVSSFAVVEAAKRVGADRSLAGLPDALVGSFDAVTLWCVLAHGPDPRPLLEQAVRSLRPGGKMFLTTPNFRFQTGYISALARLGRTIDLRDHDHVLHFTPAGLLRALTDVGVMQCRFTHVGVTEDCVAEPRLATVLVPAKRAWNRVAVVAARAGLPLLSSELQAVGTTA